MWRVPRILSCVAVLLLACDPSGGGDDATARPDGVASDGEDGLATDAFDPGEGTEILRQAVGPGGAALSSVDGVPGRRIWLTIPPGALAGTVEIAIRALPEDPADPWAVPDTVYRLEPQGLAFAVPATLVIGYDAARLRVPATAGDLAIHRAFPDGWRRVPGGGATGEVANTDLSGFSDYAVRAVDPYTDAPVLESLGTDGGLASDGTGPKAVLDPWVSLFLFGDHFGYDPAGMEVRIGGRLQGTVIPALPPWATGNRVILLSGMELDDPPVRRDEVKDYPVAVTVRGRTSNALLLQVRGQVQAGTPVITAVFPPQAPRGGLVALEGTFPGTVQTRTFTVGGIPAEGAGEDGWHRPLVRIPDDAPPGWLDVTASDGLGSPASAPSRVKVWVDAPPVLSPGIAAAGVGAGLGSNRGSVVLLFDASDWRSHDRFVEDGVEGRVKQRTRFRVRTARGETDAYTAWCGLQPEGRCALPVAEALFEGLQAGDPVTVTAFVPEKVLGTDGTLQDAERASAPLVLTLANRPLHGLMHDLAPTDEGFGPTGAGSGYTKARLRLARGDLLCFSAGPGAGEGTGEVLRAPGLWAGDLVVSPDIPGNWAEETHPACVPLPTPGTFTVTAADRGVTLEVEVALDGGEGAYELTLPVSRDLDLAVGGARLHVPAGTLGTGPTQRVNLWTHRIEDLPGAGAHWDPALQRGRTLYHLRLMTEAADGGGSWTDAKGLAHPVTLSLPYDPGRGKAPPELEFIAPDGSSWSPAAEVDPVAGTVAFTFPAGTYAAPVDGPTPLRPALRPALQRAAAGAPETVPPPVDLATLTQKIGVSYHVLEEGVLEDTDGWFRLEYVTDPASADACTEDYARDVLAHLTAAYRFLKGQGWLEPQRHDLIVTTRVRLRSSVSFWDFSAEALAATGSGWFGSPEIAVRSNLPRDNTFKSAIAHEVGHLFQRQYTVNATLSWLDEGMAEWTAFRTLGTDYAWDPDKASVAIPVLGFPSWFWGGYPRAQMYGTSALLIWFADTFGDAAVLSLYENLVVTAAYWQDPRGLFRRVSGQDLWQLNDGFGKAFWRQQYAPVDGRTSLQEELDTFLAPDRRSTATVADEQGVTLPWSAAPLSSVRLKVTLPAPVTGPLADGDLAVRASGPAVGPWEMLLLPDAVAGSPKPPAGSGTSLMGGLQTAVKVSAPFPSTLWAVVLNGSTDALNLSLRVAFPRLAGVAPSSAKAGDTLTITGHDFGATQGTVRVGGVQAPVTGWGDGTVTATMPSLPLTVSAEVRVVTAENARTNGRMITVLQ